MEEKRREKRLVYNFTQAKPVGMLNNVDNLPQAGSLSTTLASRKVVWSCRSFWYVSIRAAVVDVHC